MSEKPDCGTVPRIPIQSRDILSLTRVAALAGPDLCFRTIDLDVAGLTAGVRFAGIRAADVGDFKHHVRLPVFVPERDADVGSTVACSNRQLQLLRRIIFLVLRKVVTHGQGEHT